MGVKRVKVVSKFLHKAGAKIHGSKKKAGSLYKSLAGIVDAFASPFKVGDILGRHGSRYLKKILGKHTEYNYFVEEAKVVRVSLKCVWVVCHHKNLPEGNPVRCIIKKYDFRGLDRHFIEYRIARYDFKYPLSPRFPRFED